MLYIIIGTVAVAVLIIIIIIIMVIIRRVYVHVNPRRYQDYEPLPGTTVESPDEDKE